MQVTRYKRAELFALRRCTKVANPELLGKISNKCIQTNTTGKSSLLNEPFWFSSEPWTGLEVFRLRLDCHVYTGDNPVT